MHAIISKDILAPAVVRFWLDAPAVARNCRAGQFVILRLHERGERIPLTIADADAMGAGRRAARAIDAYLRRAAGQVC